FNTVKNILSIYINGGVLQNYPPPGAWINKIWIFQVNFKLVFLKNIIANFSFMHMNVDQQ
uniref:hypothetical protein n=1 Tax=Peribacillus frigoritolerans TaxID=450367 RepID=UPI003019917C